MIRGSCKTEQLAALVAQAGGARKAEELIKSVRGMAPSKSAIDRAIKGGGTDYNVQCMIDDLKTAFCLENVKLIKQTKAKI